MPNLQLTIKNVKRGRATVKLGYFYSIVIPEWAMHCGEDYWVYYICHECAHVTCHQLFGHMKHDADYKNN